MIDVNAVLRGKAMSSSMVESDTYAFQAQAVYFLADGSRLDKCLLGSVNYAHQFIRIPLAHKVEDWLFCAERNEMLDAGYFVGAFHQSTHYTFAHLCASATPMKGVAAAFQTWVLREAMGLFLPEAVLVPVNDTRLTPTRLREPCVVPNDQSATQFMTLHAHLLPTAAGE